MVWHDHTRMEGALVLPCFSFCFFFFDLTWSLQVLMYFMQSLILALFLFLPETWSGSGHSYWYHYGNKNRKMLRVQNNVVQQEGLTFTVTCCVALWCGGLVVTHPVGGLVTAVLHCDVVGQWSSIQSVVWTTLCGIVMWWASGHPSSQWFGHCCAALWCGGPVVTHPVGGLVTAVRHCDVVG